MRNTGLARHRPYQPKMANAVEHDFNEAPVGVSPNSLEERPCRVETCDVLWTLRLYTAVALARGSSLSAAEKPAIALRMSQRRERRQWRRRAQRRRHQLAGSSLAHLRYGMMSADQRL